ncbi:hypothetical protein, partial [Leptospira kirschneri]|uniref:hypothetical protein n=1 Tax=Leptospira kirschneri TaxID=29507 RepID=UPI001C400963
MLITIKKTMINDTVYLPFTRIVQLYRQTDSNRIREELLYLFHIVLWMLHDHVLIFQKRGGKN